MFSWINKKVLYMKRNPLLLKVIFKWVVDNFAKSIKNWLISGLELVQTPSINSSIWVDCKRSQTFSGFNVSNKNFIFFKKPNFDRIIIIQLLFHSKLTAIVLSEDPYSSVCIKEHSITCPRRTLNNLMIFLKPYRWLLIEHVICVINNFEDSVLLYNFFFIVV